MQIVSSMVAVSCYHNSTHASAQMCAGYPWLPESEQKADAPAAVAEVAICPLSSILWKPSTADQPVSESQVTQTLTRMVYLCSVRLITSCLLLNTHVKQIDQVRLTCSSYIFSLKL